MTTDLAKVGYIPYEKIVADTTRTIIVSFLEKVRDLGAGHMGNHAAYVTLMTNLKGVVMSDALKQRYPKIIVLVFENQFSNFIIDREAACFHVDMSFGGVSQTLTFPFASLIRYVDKCGVWAETDGEGSWFPIDLHVDPRFIEQEEEPTPAPVSQPITGGGEVIPVQFGNKTH